MRNYTVIQFTRSAIVLLLFTAFGFPKAFAQTGPGGVGNSTTNELWLRAGDLALSDGVLVTVNWEDQSGNDHHASQGNGANQPTYQAGEINGQPVVRFDGTDDFLDDVYSYSAQTVFSVYRVSGTTQGTSELAQIWGNYGDGVQVGPDPRSGANERGYSFDGVTSSGTTARYAHKGAAFGSYATNDNTSQWSYDATELITAEFQSSESLTRQVIGSLYPSFTIGDHQFGGDIAEIIVYNITLNSAERIVVENYLASKYDITISNDLYSYESTHANDVAGIGRNGADQNTAAYSAGILQISNPTSPHPGDWMFFGHNDGGVSSWNTAESPNTETRRIGREWRIDQTNGIGSVTYTIDSANLPAMPSGFGMYALLVDADGNFSSGATVHQLTDQGGGKYASASLTVADGEYVTVAVVDASIGFTSATASGQETITSPSFDIEVNFVPAADLNVTYATANGTAGTADFTATGATVATISAGSTSTSFNVTVNNDTLLESDETFTINLSNGPSTVPFSDSVMTYTIQDEDNPRKIYFALATSSITEDNTTVNVTVELDSVDLVNPSTVQYAVTSGTATGGGSDYTLASGTATITATNSSTTFSVSIVEDVIFEGDETIVISLSSPTNSNLSGVKPIVHTLTISDDEVAPTVGLSSTSSSASESTTSVNIGVELTAIAGSDVSVDYSVTGGDAAGAGNDYTLAAGTATITAGNLTTNIVLTIVDDGTVELDETVEVTITNATVVSMGADSVYTYTILNDDVLGTTGPAGVGDAGINELWLKAEDIAQANGSTVSSWSDASGNGHNASSSGGNQPTYRTTSANGQPAVRFDGIDDDFNDAHVYSGRTVFAVFNASSSTQSNADLAQLWGNYGDGVQLSIDPRSGNLRGFSFDGNGSTTGAVSLNGASPAGFVEDGNAQQWAYDSWNVVSVEFDATTTINRQVIGSLLPALNNHNFGGDMAELIVYSDVMNTAQRKIIQNYLAAKYGVTIGSDLYGYESTHSNDVAGIGREDASNFHVSAQSGGILTARNANNLDDGDFLLYGHDDGSIASFGTSDVPNTSTRRVSREWRMSETGEVGSLTIEIDATTLPSLPSGFTSYALLVDADGTFADTSSYYVLTNTAGSLYEAQNVNITDGDYVTIVAVENITSATGDFNLAATWTDGAVPSAGEPAIISANHEISVTADRTIGSLYISTGAVIDMGSNTITLNTGSITNLGSFDAGVSTVLYSGSVSQSVAPVAYHHLSFSGSGTKTLGGDITLTGNLLLSAGTLDADAGNDHSISLRGNWDASSGTFVARSGTVTFNGLSGQNVISDGSSFSNVIVSNSGTGLTLGDEMTVSNILTLTDGVVTTGANTLIVSSTSASAVAGFSSASFVNGTIQRGIASNTDTYSFPVGNGAGASNYYRADIVNGNMTGVSNITASFGALANHVDGDMTATDAQITYTSMNTAGTWTITPNSQPGGGSYSAQLYITNVGGLTDNEFGILKRGDASTSGADWSDGGGTLSAENGSGRLVAGGFALRTGLTSFSEFGIGEGTSGTGLPIVLLDFTAEDKGDKVQLNWATAAEINNDFFTIERSRDGQEFEVLLTQEGAGNSTQVLYYEDLDDDPLEGISYYRLKQTDFDGAYEYSDVVAVDRSKNTTVSIDVYPNPTIDGNLTIDVKGMNPLMGETEISITGLDGKIVYRYKLINEAERSLPVQLDENLNKGMYFITITHGERVLHTKLLLE